MIPRCSSGTTMAGLILLAGISSDWAQANSAIREQTRQGLQMKWQQAELAKIIKADDLHISVFRDDSVSYGTPTFIWCVEVDGDLYVRAYNGVKSRWYQAALQQKAGRIIAAGKTIDVVFEPVSGALNDRIDDAYRAKYSTSSYLAPMISERSRAVTMRVLPTGTAQ